MSELPGVYRGRYLGSSGVCSKPQPAWRTPTGLLRKSP